MNPLMHHLSVARVILYVKDIQKVASFYVQFFDMKPLAGATSGWVELESASGGWCDCASGLVHFRKVRRRSFSYLLGMGCSLSAHCRCQAPRSVVASRFNFTDLGGGAREKHDGERDAAGVRGLWHIESFRAIAGRIVVEYLLQRNTEDVRDAKGNFQRWRVLMTFDGVDGLTSHKDVVGKLLRL